jgi:hypothetical protein
LHLNKLSCSRDNSSSVCDACQLAKSHQLPYTHSIHHSTSPLEIIHSDVWGPAPSSVGGFSYYISFIDDFSKFCWIYLMHARTDAPRIFMEFKTHVERLIDRKIKCVQSDWGGEYKKIHNTFFHSLGNTHRVSCPHTHQQNGLAKRKHHHIVETALALLAHAHIPIKFWDDAFLTTTYLINRMPTRVIDNTSPLERFFHTPPNYSMLRVFGCACWPHLQPYNKHKLSFRSKECVFLGYSSLHKGYKCFDPDSGRIYISREVIFDENVFPFQRLSMSPNPPLRDKQLDDHSILLSYDPMHVRLPAVSLDADNPANACATSRSAAGASGISANDGHCCACSTSAGESFSGFCADSG